MNADELDDSRPAYQRLADELRDDIAGGRLQPGQKVPSVRQLAEQRGVAPMTVQSALRALASEGLVASVVGRGTYVRAVPPPKEAPIGERMTALEYRLADLERRFDSLEAPDGNDAKS